MLTASHPSPSNPSPSTRHAPSRSSIPPPSRHARARLGIDRSLSNVNTFPSNMSPPVFDSGASSAEPGTRPASPHPVSTSALDSLIEPSTQSGKALGTSSTTKHDKSATSMVEKKVPAPPPPLSSQPPFADTTSLVSPLRHVQATTENLSMVSSSAKRRKSLATCRESLAPPTIQPKRVKSNTSQLKAVPVRYELCPIDDMVILIAYMLSELIETNDPLALKGNGSLTRFHSRTAPGISVHDYLSRLAKHATLTQPLLLSIIYYIDRLCAMYPDFTINTLTVHRFLITAATVASKGLSDSFWNNATYARVGGVRLAELRLLELEFLYRVDWRIVPNPEVLRAYYRGLVERCPSYGFDGNYDEEERSTEGKTKAVKSTGIHEDMNDPLVDVDSLSSDSDLSDGSGRSE